MYCLNLGILALLGYFLISMYFNLIHLLYHLNFLHCYAVLHMSCLVALMPLCPPLGPILDTPCPIMPIDTTSSYWVLRKPTIGKML